MSGSPTPVAGRGRMVAWLSLLPLWILVVVFGMVVLVRYSLGPGRPADAPSRWPAASHAMRNAGQPALVMIAHPRCACTRASLSELAILMTRCAGKVSATVVFVRPSGTSSEWNDTDLRQTATAIPGVIVLADSDGHEAELFGAVTSGQVLLYDAAGRLQFTGGITAGRGHAGDNAGRSTIEAFVAAGRSERTATPVFGCELFEPHSRTPNTRTRTW